MWDYIEYLMAKSDYYLQLASDYWFAGNDHMSAAAELKSAQFYNRALRLLGQDWYEKVA